MDDNDLPSKDIEKLLELYGNKESACINKYTGAYKHDFCGDR